MSSERLQEMYTDQCKSSIASYRQGVESACPHDEYDGSGNSTNVCGSSGVYRPIVLPDYYFTNYHQRCLLDADGNYCLFHLQSTDSQDECDACGLRMFRTELSNSYFYNDDLAEQYSSLTSSCGASNMDLPTPISVVLSSSSASTPTPTTCADRSATIHSGDTCDRFAAANNVSTWRMLIENGLQGGCVDFPSSGELCVTGHCQTHLVTAQDTCMSLASQYGITVTQLITWSSVLNSLCSNFGVVVGHQICVSYRGNASSEINTYASAKFGATASVAAPVPTDVVVGINVNCGKYYQVKENDYCQAIAMAQGISLSDFYFLNPEVNGNCTNLYLNYSYCVQPVGNIETYPGYATTTTTGASPPTTTAWWGTRVAWEDLPIATNLTPWVPIVTPTTAPLANNTRLDCDEYTDNTLGSVPCDWLALGVDIGDFASWNPSVDVYNCTLANNTRYCTLLGSGYDISNLPVDPSLYYADVPPDAAVNSTHECYNWYHTSKATPCEDILSYANISLTAFYAWNPSVKSDCSNVWLNVSYCISGDGYDDTYYAASTTSSASSIPTSTACAGVIVTAPGPTQTGIPCDCNKYAQQADGVYCQDMAIKYGITLDEFYKLNPALNGDCSGLWAGYAYCVGVPGLATSSPTITTTGSTSTTASSTACATVTPPGPTQSNIPCTCNKYLMQADGVYCYDMAAEEGITLEQLYEWNPSLNGDCSGLWPGYAYCVGVL
ncbi:hypothetical protein CNMCM5623_005526 [Aspergillus felis]|uniref:LysM domain-containing protein n=1 Tax=Aspergillus felis TaxID=1287682 RepID=A0A8H6V481_9EURO|nr:hypothetical protein CNMCM5623_005526 [Aspergillus felis]